MSTIKNGELGQRAYAYAYANALRLRHPMCGPSWSGCAEHPATSTLGGGDD